MENSKSKTISCPPSEDLEKNTEVVTEKEDDQSEIRLIIEMSCTVEVDENSSETKLNLLLRLEDQMNRKLSCSVSEDETGIDLANELVEYGLISEIDRDKVANMIDEHLEIPTE